MYVQVFLEYADTDSSSKARGGMNGRKFGGNQVVAVFYPENKFAEGDYDGWSMIQILAPSLHSLSLAFWENVD